MNIDIVTVVKDANAFAAMSATTELLKAVDQIYYNVQSKSSNSIGTFRQVADIICDSDLNLKNGVFEIGTQGDNERVSHKFTVNGKPVGNIVEYLH